MVTSRLMEKQNSITEPIRALPSVDRTGVFN